MGKRSKRFKKASELINRDQVYAIDQAVEILKSNAVLSSTKRLIWQLT